MEGRSPEFLPPTPEKTDDGFSEKKLARQAEGRSRDKVQGKKRKPVILPNRLLRPARTGSPTLQLPFTRREKIVSAYKDNLRAMIKLMETLYEVDGANIRQEEQIIEDVRRRRLLEQELIKALLLEQKGQLVEDSLSKEASDLIK